VSDEWTVRLLRELGAQDRREHAAHTQRPLSEAGEGWEADSSEEANWDVMRDMQLLVDSVIG
jgi:hypothetical protein